MIGLNFLFSLPGKILIGALVLGGIYGAGYFKGKSDGKIDQLRATVEAHENRDEVDESVANLSAVERCIELGGLPDDCASIVRGMDETTGSQ